MGGTGQVTALILGIILGVLISPVEGRFLRFEPGYEYQYKFHSDAQVHGVDTFTVAARVGYSCLRELDEGQEVTIRVIAFTLESSKTSQAQGHDWDFSKWFSFVLTSRGEVLRVLHEPDEQAEILAIKKALAGILAARLHDDKDKDIIDIISTNDGWKYHIQETGHEGLHNATYEVHTSDDGKIFTKTRHNHPVPHATGAYTKTMHYHEDMRILHTVEVQEHFDTLDNPPEGYTSHFKGHQSPDMHFEDEKVVVPSMTGQGRGKLEFLTRLRLRNDPELPKVKLVTGSVHVDKVPSRQPHANLTTVIDDITGNLTCMRLQPAKGSKALMDCFALMLDVLQQLPDHDLEKLIQDYFGPKSRQEHHQRDRESMMDGLWSVKSDHVQQLLTESVLLTEDPEVIFVERLLYHVASTDNLPAESIVQTIISLAFKPEEHAAIFHKGEIHHRVLLTLGVFINLLNKDGQTQRASELALELQSMLGIHDPWVYRKKRETMTEWEAIDEDLRKVVLLETLGNGRLDQSYEYIVSHVNSTTPSG
ncbi:uncharacterized protein LOC112558274 [Pomacea canaliculata]|uniref:uncharacterized protein LOC112558274 n=1 Tax=Pomacea canaliculata TaxID=400727 RepID=UPI000D72F9DB|nr:uncharacterized protein LOC112558274 [Pomacea canaliculata]